MSWWGKKDAKTRLLISASTTHAVKLKLLKRYQVAVKETSGGHKASELGFILSLWQTFKIGECHATHYSFPCKCKSNLKSDSGLNTEINFLPEQGWSISYLYYRRNDFDGVIKNLVLNLPLIYKEMNRGLHDIPQIRLGWHNFNLNLSPLTQQDIVLAEVSRRAKHACNFQCIKLIVFGQVSWIEGSILGPATYLS